MCVISLKKTLPKIESHPSTIILMIPNVIPMIGANQNTVATGLCIPNFLSLSRSCVRDQRRPERALPEITRINPPRTKWVSVATMRTTPDTMSAITPISRKEKISSRKRKAKRRTNTSEDDLTMASAWSTVST